MRRVHAYGTAVAWRSKSRIAADTIAALRDRGHAAEAAAPWTTAVGGMQGIAIDPATGVMTGGCDPRRDGFVAAA